MALFVQQNDNRSKIQERVAAELREKAKARAELDNKLPDGVEDSNYLKDTKKTTTLAWIWVLIVAFAVIAFGYFVYVSAT